MATVKRIVCLANSRKLHGRCVAGREWVKGKAGVWVRPVSDRQHEEVSEQERQYQDGSDPVLLDFVDLPLREPRPKDYQQENWLIEPDEYWVKQGQLPWGELDKLADKSGTLWLNG